MSRHPFLDDTICVTRLLREYGTHGSLVIAYDFDNTVFDYHDKGHDYSEVINIIQRARHLGCYLICFTAKPVVDYAKVSDYLIAHQIPFDSINENPPFFKEHTTKIYYNLLLDDRAGLKSAYNQLKTLFKILDNQI